MKRFITLSAILLLGTALGVGMMTFAPTLNGGVKTSFAADSAPPVAEQQLEKAADLSQAFQHVADRLRPAVVSISSVKRIQPIVRQPRQSGPQISPFPDELR